MFILMLLSNSQETTGAIPRTVVSYYIRYTQVCSFTFVNMIFGEAFNISLWLLAIAYKLYTNLYTVVTGDAFQEIR